VNHQGKKSALPFGWGYTVKDASKRAVNNGRHPEYHLKADYFENNNGARIISTSNFSFGFSSLRVFKRLSRRGAGYESCPRDTESSNYFGK